MAERQPRIFREGLEGTGSVAGYLSSVLETLGSLSSTKNAGGMTS